jgi:hypothetical protein
MRLSPPTTAMLLRIPLAPLALIAGIALVPGPAAAAPYKCVVDGKTTYQDRPCDPTDKDKGMMTSDTVQSKNNRTLTGITVVSREENLRRAAVAKRELEPQARDAFAAMRDGNMNAWAQMLCPQVKMTFQRGPLAGMVKQQGAGYAKRKVELTKATEIGPEGVTFVYAEAAAPPAGSAYGQQFLRVHYQWYDGQPCLTHIDDWRAADRKR